MSMPSLPEPNPDLTKEQALNMILTSIALEETALSHIINAEGEKIQSVLAHYPCNVDAILSVNNSVKETLEVVMQNQMLLKSKMEKALEHLPKTNQESCKEHHCCDLTQHYTAVPGKYCDNQLLLWKKDNCGQKLEEITLPYKGCVTVDFMAELFLGEQSHKLQAMIDLRISCDNRPLFCRTFYPYENNCNSRISGTTSFYLPCDCGECSASVILYLPCNSEVKKAEITFFK